MKETRKAERKIIINHTGTADADDIRLKLLKLMARGTGGGGACYDSREAEQYRDLHQDKQG